MRYALVTSVCFLLQVAACKHTTPPAPRLDGTYTGTFQRQYGGSGRTSQVSLVFSGGKWSGTGQTPKYPGLCSGTYEISGNNKINFTNSCIWTAEFDWSLILAHEYELKITGNNVEMSRDNPPYRDVYQLAQ